jgi:hypothetical protein
MISRPSDHPVPARNVVVVDLSIDALLMVDGQAGGDVVGHVVLHDQLDNNVNKWLNPLSVATCNPCKHIFMMSKNMLYIIDLDRPLKDMANNCNFLLLLSASLAVAP